MTRGMFAASGVFQIVFSGSLAIGGAGLLVIGRFVENVQQLLRIFSGLIEQRDILRIADV